MQSLWILVPIKELNKFLKLEVEAINSYKIVGGIFRLKSKSLRLYNSYTKCSLFFFSIMANTLSLHSLLNSDKLIRPNFDSWYQKLKIILEHKKLFYVLTDPTLEGPLQTLEVWSKTLTRSHSTIVPWCIASCRGP